MADIYYFLIGIARQGAQVLVLDDQELAFDLLAAGRVGRLAFIWSYHAQTTHCLVDYLARFLFRHARWGGGRGPYLGAK